MGGHYCLTTVAESEYVVGESETFLTIPYWLGAFLTITSPIPLGAGMFAGLGSASAIANLIE